MRTVIGSTCLLIFALLGCNLRPTVRGNEGALQSKTETVEDITPSDLQIDFEGVSFTYDPRVFGDVKKRVVPESKLEDPTFRPDYVAPEYVSFEFEFGREFSKARIGVFPVDKFDDVHATNPEMVKYIKRSIEDLKQVVEDPSRRIRGQIPHLEFEDSSNDVYAKVHKLDFAGGHGVIFVTHWSIENDLMSNRNLIYRFEGFTNDGKFYVTATTPVSVAFLPDDPATEFEGHTYENLFGQHSNSREALTRIKKYREDIASRLEKLNSSDYSPSLEKFEAMISSLKVSR